MQGRVVRAPPVLALTLMSQAPGLRDVSSLLSCVQPTLDISALSPGGPLLLAVPGMLACVLHPVLAGMVWECGAVQDRADLGLHGPSGGYLHR